MAASSDTYRCVCCGMKTPELFKKYSSSVLRLTECNGCHQLVDKYIEYDPVIVMIDLVLQKLEAYRHLLFNDNIPSYWKLAMAFIVCETFARWRHYQPEFIELELSFYLVSFYCIIENAAFFAGIFVWIKFLHIFNPIDDTATTIVQLLKGLSIAQFGKLFLLLGVIWIDDEMKHSPANVVFVAVIVFMSNVQMVSVMSGRGRLCSIIMVASSLLLQSVVSYAIS